MYWTSSISFAHGFLADHPQEGSAESVPLETCTVADRHWVRPQSTEAGQGLDRTQVLLSIAQLDFSSGSEIPAGVSSQKGSGCLDMCRSTSIAKAHAEEDPGVPRSKEGDGTGQFSSSLW